jgi:hypothetical protein
MGFYPDSPAPRDLGQETKDTLQAEIDLAPQRYAAEAKYRGLYDQLDQQSIQNALYGSGGNRGLLDIYFKDIAPQSQALERQAAAGQREADISAVEQLGPRATAAMRAVNPQQTALLDAITQQSTADVRSGYNLPPGLADVVNQSVRSGQAARGLGYGPADAYSETLARSDAANQWHGQNLDRGMRVAATNAATQTDPFLAILGRPAATPQAAMGLLGGGQSQGLQGQSVYGRFDPTNAYAQDLYNTNFNAKAAANIAASNMKAGMVNAGVNLVGQMIPDSV